MLPSIISTSVASLCLCLSVWLFVTNSSGQKLQAELQQKQQEIQTEQQKAQLQQQELQAQQDQINSATQLAQQTGPAILRDLNDLAVVNNNTKIKELLAKYGVQAQAAPKTDAPAAP